MAESSNAGVRSRTRSRGSLTVDRALLVLEALKTSGGPMRLRDVAAAVHLNPTAVHRLLSSLTQGGLVEQDPETRSYRLGWGFLEYSDTLLRGTQLADVCPPIARRLRDHVGETVSVQVRSAGDRVCIFEAEGLHDLRRRVGVGARLPLYASPSGRAILAFLPPREVDELLSKKLEPVTAQTTTDIAKLRAILEEIRRTGIARSHDEAVIGASAIASPIFSATEGWVASIAVTGPTMRWNALDQEDLERSVLAAAADVSERLGATTSHPWLAELRGSSHSTGSSGRQALVKT